jgi:hypothetical protein
MQVNTARNMTWCINNLKTPVTIVVDRCRKLAKGFHRWCVGFFAIISLGIVFDGWGFTFRSKGNFILIEIVGRVRMTSSMFHFKTCRVPEPTENVEEIKPDDAPT